MGIAIGSLTTAIPTTDDYIVFVDNADNTTKKSSISNIPSAGNVNGPATSTDNAITRYDGATGKIIQDSLATLDDTGILSTTSIAVNGTNGNGHVHLKHQASTPSGTGSSTTIYADSNGNFAFKNNGGFTTTVKTNTNTANRIYTFPDADATIARTDSAQTFTGIQTITQIDLGNTDTSITRSSAGIIAVEGVAVPTVSSPGTLINKNISGASNTLTVDGTNAVGFKEIPQNSQSVAYTLVLSDAGKHIYHPSADTTARIWTIPANSSVAFPIGTAITFINDTSAGAITIAITTDTLVLAGAGTTGSRTLAANGIATATKVTSTRWIISGVNLT